MAEDEWTPVSRRRTKKNELKGEITSYYVTNFPIGTSIQQLWAACSSIGEVVDVYMATKKNNEGKRFAFIRFARTQNKGEIEKRLNEVRCGGQKFKANISRYNRRQVEEPRIG
ncbi:hypothetical protein L1887_03498 [Cichorium endivia]|nr:hypothetical protein L1887_03498 [Cichorium endivia]